MTQDWRWIFRLAARASGYAFVGYLLFAYIVFFAVMGLGQVSTRSLLNPQNVFLAGVPSAILFGYGALRSKPRQKGDDDAGMLFNLIFWTFMSLLFGCVLLWLGLNLTEQFLVLPSTPRGWNQTFALWRPAVVFAFCAGLQAVGVHLALSRVARRVGEEEAKTPRNLAD